jgi:hypothetical protein
VELNPLFVNIIAVIAMITGLSIAAWWLIGLYWIHSRKHEQELPEIELPANLHEVFTGVPPVLIVFYAFIALSLVSYVLYIWLGGITY